MEKAIIFRCEEVFHAAIHLLATALMFYLIIRMPLLISILLVVLWKLQFVFSKECIFTRFAHKRKIMLGMSYWEYLSYILGFTDYKKAGYLVDKILKFIIAGILICRLFFLLSGLK